MTTKKSIGTKNLGLEVNEGSMAQKVTPHALQQKLQSRHPMVVEYYHESRDPVVAHAVDKAALWMEHHHQEAAVPVYRINIKHHAQALDDMGVRILPQPSTVAIYSQSDVEMFSGRLDSSKKLVQRIAGGGKVSGGGGLAAAERAVDQLSHNLFGA